MPSYYATRSVATRRRQYEAGDPVLLSTLADDERQRFTSDGSIVPARFVGLAADLARQNPIVAAGLVAYATDTGDVRIGDGVTAWSSLPAPLSGTYVRLQGRPINVRDYIDPVAADHSTGIRNAITAANGAPVEFGHIGTAYLVGSAIALPNDTYLRSQPGHWMGTGTATRTEIKATGDWSIFQNQNYGTNSNENITLEDLDIVGYNGGTRTADVVKMGGNGANFVHKVRMVGCTVSYGRHSISFDRVMESEFERCWSLYGSNYALRLATCTDNIIHGCQISSDQTTGLEGVFLTGASDNNIITDNFIFLSKSGIYLDGGANNVISGNRSNTNRNTGIYLAAGSASALVGTQVTNNICYDNGQSAVGICAGIGVDGATAKTLVSGNVCRDTQGTKTQVSGIRVAGTADYNAITGNLLTDNKTTDYSNTSSGVNNAYKSNMVGGVWVP